MKHDRPSAKNFAPLDFPSTSQFDVCELKYDGWLLVLELEGRNWKIWSRSGELKKDGDLGFSIERTVLLGEYCYGTEWSKDRPEYYDKLAVFGAEEVLGVDVTRGTVEENRERARQVVEMLQHPDARRIRNGCFLIDQWPISEAPRLWDEYVVKQQFEGLIFKNACSPWNAGFGRMKNTVTMDYVCIGMEDSDSDSYAGWGVASVIGGLFMYGVLTKACRVSGLTDDRRREFFENRDKYIGRVFEAQGKKLSKKGSLRHPDFLRFRDDKLPEECVWPPK